MYDKSDQLEIYLNKIYPEIIISLRNQFKDIPYDIPTKKTVYVKIRKNRGVMNLNSVQAAITKPQRSIKDKLFLLRQSFLEIHCEYHQIMLRETN
ncbi:hypothetical protein HZS_277 [Henneguya salminicola]|nr:hypothetical protein HZS_277 [Henneguya salminicola]